LLDEVAVESAKPNGQLHYVLGRSITIEEVTELANKPVSEEQLKVLKYREEYSSEILKLVMQNECKVNTFVVVLLD
jgi:hypothetical protein